MGRNTLQFFFHEKEKDFALYTEAIKFFNHSESMVRIAVRTLTLNVYKVEDEAMRTFILDRTAAPYFRSLFPPYPPIPLNTHTHTLSHTLTRISNLVWFIRDQMIDIDKWARKSTGMYFTRSLSLCSCELYVTKMQRWQ